MSDFTPIIWCVKCGAESTFIRYDGAKRKWLYKCSDCKGFYAITNGIIDELKSDEVMNCVIARYGT